jgi:hypothetical protein
MQQISRPLSVKTFATARKPLHFRCVIPDTVRAGVRPGNRLLPGSFRLGDRLMCQYRFASGDPP